VKLLLDKNADVESKDGYGLTPLSWAAEVMTRHHSHGLPRKVMRR
jgi:hypothetical protein